ncbi:hypothetical protein Q7P37_002370 [Cladosporium fusiforme]
MRASAMRASAVIATGASLVLPVLASGGRDGHGLIGYGITMYRPACAFACQSSISNPLDCPDDDHHHDMDGMVMKRMSGMDMEKPSPECYANNEPYLQTLAYCISTHCSTDVTNSSIDRFFEMSLGGRLKQPPKPLYAYAEALLKIETPPTNQTDPEEMLTKVSLIDEEYYIANLNGNDGFQFSEARHSLYSLVLLSTCILIPILASFLHFLPLPGRLTSRLNAYLNYPPLVGSRHSTPLFNLMIMPTRGQSLFLFYLVAINIILCAVGYESRQPNSWYASQYDEIISFVGNRTGALSLVNLALTVLYAGRNNFLIYLTDWPHSSYLLYHRWVAGIATLQACIHSAIYLYKYLEINHTHASEAKLDYWVWGIIATLGMTFLLPTSILPLRQKFYELFLIWHIIVAFFVILGCYLHIFLRFERQWGYELWTYIAFGIWGFDRIVRLARLARNGVCKAQVTVIDEDYIRLDIPGVTGEGQAYIYFPTLTWRIWENHPFSIAGGFLHTHSSGAPPNEEQTKHPISSSASSTSASPSSPSSNHEISLDIEKTPQTTTTTTTTPLSRTTKPKFSPTPALTFIIRTHTGTTALLRTRTTLPVLLEASYTGSLLHPTTTHLNNHPHLLCIAGGVGITALLPLLASHRGNRSLAWGVRRRGLVDGLRDLVVESEGMRGVDVETFVGRRMDVRAVVEGVLEGSEGGVAVVVSGPAGMADEVRGIVAELAAREGKSGRVVSFVEESYSW